MLDTALSASDRPPGVFSSPPNRATKPPRAYNAQIVTPKPIEMNTCTKTGAGRETFRDLVFVAAAFRRADYEAFSLPKSMGIILLHKKDEQLS
jgi:hypothetical protein